MPTSYLRDVRRDLPPPRRLDLRPVPYAAAPHLPRLPNMAQHDPHHDRPTGYFPKAPERSMREHLLSDLPAFLISRGARTTRVHRGRTRRWMPR